VGAQRRVNELVKRTKLLRAIAVLTNFLREEMPFFGKESKKEKVYKYLYLFILLFLSIFSFFFFFSAY
jgi:polyferredoxin